MVINILKGVWKFCSYLFLPRRRPKDDGAELRNKQKVDVGASAFCRFRKKVKENQKKTIVLCC